MIHKRKFFFMDFVITAALTAFVFLLAGCGSGLPEKLKQEARAIPDAVKAGYSQVNKYKDQYQDLTESSEFKAVKRFALKEKWSEKFSQAKDELSRAKELYDKKIKPLLDQNKPELAHRVSLQITRIKTIIKAAKALYTYPSSRFSMIRNTINNAETLQSRARTEADQIEQIVTEVKTGPLAKAFADFPDLNQKLTARTAPLSKLESQSREHFKIILAEYKNHMAGSHADYAAFTDSSKALSSILEQAGKLKEKLTREIALLYKSYTKILKDMKEEYFVTIKRESWNDNSDFYDPWDVTFQRQVNLETYEALTADNLDTIAEITAGFMGSKFTSHIGRLWNQLSINPTGQWPGRGHNAASFWVDDAKIKYFHKYLLEENGETRKTGWEQVSESFYEANLEFLGMAILSKPYGVFEQDRMTQAAPPGMAYVGNPEYGEWKKDDKGDRFWSWYGKYAFFSSLFFYPRSYFYYNSWYGWRNNYQYKKPYFGRTGNGFHRYGTSGTYVRKSPRFQNTNFAKRGGFKSQTPSVRGAGPGLRGGGPKSKGK